MFSWIKGAFGLAGKVVERLPVSRGALKLESLKALSTLLNPAIFVELAKARPTLTLFFFAALIAAGAYLMGG